MKTYKYEVECPECHETRTITTNRPSLCRSCSRKRLGNAPQIKRYANIPKLRYKHFCLGCYKEWTNTVKRQFNYCGDCSRKFTKRNKWIGSFDMTAMEWAIKNTKPRFFRVCEICGDIQEVKSKQSAQNRRCLKHKVAKPKGVAHKKKRPNKVSKRQIEEARKLNRQHLAFVSEQNKKAIPKQKKTDDEMLAEWLKNNKPSIEVDDSLPLIRVDQIRGD